MPLCREGYGQFGFHPILVVPILYTSPRQTFEEVKTLEGELKIYPSRSHTCHGAARDFEFELLGNSWQFMANQAGV
jgi:hypothetical protein